MRIRLVPIRQILSTLTPGGSNGGRSPLGTPFFHIFRRATKDMATGGRRYRSEAGKNVGQKAMAPGGTSSTEKNQFGKNVKQKEMAAESTGSR